MEHTSANGFIAVSEAAEKWGVSPRQVQRLAAANRIPGAKKFGRDYHIPADAEKPAGYPQLDQRTQPQASLSAELDHINEIAVTWPNLTWVNPDALAAAIPDEPYRPYRLFVEGWLAYLRGDFERTIQNFREIENQAVKLWACHLAIAAAVSTGDYPLYKEIETYCKGMIAADLGANVTAAAQWTLAAVAVDMFVPAMIPDWLKNGDFSALPAYLRCESFCYQTHYLYFIKEYQSALDIARTALNFFAPENGMTSMCIHLRFICAMSCCALGRLDDVEKYLSDLMKDCLPSGIITPFAEHLLLLNGLVERSLKRDYPEYYDAVIGLTKRVIPNWRSFHERFNKDNISLILEPREYQMALAAARGDTDAEIAQQFHLAFGTVRNYMQIIYEKLAITEKPRRKELVKYLW